MHDDFPILAAIAANPAHSYQVLEHLQAMGVKATRSTLYRRVDALIAQGMVVATEGRGARGHSRRDLSLTDAGRKMVARDIPEVLRNEPLESPVFALALGCARITDTEGLPTLLKPRMASAARALTREERDLHTNSDGSEYWARVARERRIAHLQADIAWLQSIVARRIVATSRPHEDSATA